ncbi:MAG: ADP-forming succinate--CoA ligase subunit beta [candidate division KSB1 bacterium]|nr:ADP-forming succinate--CoA ligase subunit beta [candidate division KSB1 bacterium]
MKIHEFQAKKLLRRHGVAVPRGEVVSSPAEARRVTAELGGRAVLKAQIHAGGRGKAGGIRLARTPEEAESLASQMLGSRLVTAQTGPEGRIVRRILVEEAVEAERELYAGVVLDRAAERVVLMASSEGGVEIEEVAARSPEKILKEYADPAYGLASFQLRRLCLGLGLRDELLKQALPLLGGLYEAYTALDASLAEINPLVLTRDGRLLALDAKVNLDDNGLFRHPDLLALRDLDEEDPLEVEASRYHLNYIRLDGNVGCMVNGAGLAMATMDIVKLYGGSPANFLDVGGGASAETVANGFRILLSDPRVKAVLINIFGGIVRCDRVAQGVIEASRQVGVKVPIVVRLQGTNAEEAAALLHGSGLNFIVASDLAEAAEKAVRAASA